MNVDHALKTEVLAELTWEPSVNADHIGVTARDGVITLTGHVPTYWQKQAAERAASRVKGVRAIAEELQVQLHDDSVQTDEDIAINALHALEWSAPVPMNAVQVRVQDGQVTLTGEVAWHFEVDEAARAIRALSGVKGISNKITVQVRPDTSKIKGEIDVALHRSWLSSGHVDVSAAGGKVHLTGRVESWQDRNMASTTAWRAKGTTSVVNDIHVA